jgi:hypothetical protein
MAVLLYVGDCKMAALDTRASLEAQQDYYLCPLAAKQMPEEVLDEYLQPVWAKMRPCKFGCWLTPPNLHGLPLGRGLRCVPG